MKKLQLIFLYLAVFSCKAQQEYPLSTSISDITQNSYIRDYNNELNPYVGVYKSTFKGKEMK